MKLNCIKFAFSISCASLFVLAGVCLMGLPAQAKTVSIASGGDIAAAITEATSDANPAVVILGAGDYAPAKTISISAAVTLRGADGTKREDVRVSGSNARGVFQLNHAQAVLSGITVEKGKLNLSGGSGVRVETAGGCVTNCIVRNCQGTGGSQGMVYLGSDNAYCFNSVLSNYTGSGWGGGVRPGGCLFVAKGKAANCFITDGHADLGVAFWGPGVRIDGGVVANCTIVGNRSSHDGAVLVTGGKMVNCLIWGNMSDGCAANGYDVVYPSTGGGSAPATYDKARLAYLENCVARYAVNDKCVAADDIAATGVFWTPLPGSAVIDVGQDLEWLPSVDLNGNPRKVGDKVDAGCCEYQGEAAAIAFTAAPFKGFAPMEVTFTATITNAVAGKYVWDFGDGSATVETDDPTTTHTYTKTGVFSPKVTNGSLTWTSKDRVTVRAASVSVSTTAELDAALAAAVDGQEIVLAKGTYETTARRMVAAGLTVRGATGDPADVVLKTKSAKYGSLIVNAAGATVASLTIDGDAKNSGANGLVKLDYWGGTLTNCIVRNGLKSGNGCANLHAVGAKALVTHCIVTNNSSTTDSQATINSSALVLQDGARASNCLIAHNTMTGSDTRSNRSNAAGAVLYDNNDNQLENCTIVDNTGDTIGGVCVHKGKVINCVIGKNTSTGWGASSANIKPETESKFTFCKITDDVASGYFANYATGDYTVAAGSPLIDAGDTASLAAIPSVDLVGNERVMGQTDPALIDIGAYEFNPNVFGVSFSVSVSQSFSPASVTFAADVSGTNGTDEIAFIWTIGTAAPVTNRVSSLSRTLTAAGTYDAQVVVTNLTKGGTSQSDAKSPAVYVVPKKMLVIAGNENPAFPYDTKDNAAATLAEALAVAIPGSVIELAPGQHAITSTVKLEQKLTIRGGGATPGEVILENPTGSYGTEACCYRFNHPEARVENLTFKLTNVNNCPSLRFYGDGGVISNCVVTGFSHEACVHNASDATLVTHTVFTNVTLTTQGGGGLRPKGFICDATGKGRYSNCLFDGNYYSPSEEYPFFWLRGTLENCTVVSNRFRQGSFKWDEMPPNKDSIGQRYGGNIRYLLLPYEATARANVFAANTTNDVPTFTYGSWEASSMVVGNVSDGMQVGEGGVIASAEALFCGPAKGDWRLRGGSVAVDVVPKASASELSLPSFDLKGNPRVFGSGLDAGCYECPSGGMCIIVR